MPRYQIKTSYNMEWLKSKINELNKKAAKLGVEPITLTIVEERVEQAPFRGHFETEYHQIEGRNVRMIRIYVVDVEGNAPVINGWKFISTLQHIRDEEGARTLVRTVPGQETPEKFREAPNWCDYCKTDRYRTDTFVVKNEAGEYKQVGRQCLRDFLGHSSPEMYAKWATSLGLLEEMLRASDHESAEGFRDDRIYNIKMYLAFVVEEMKRHGWISRSRAYEEGKTSTADVAWNRMMSFIGASTMQEKKDYFPSKASIDSVDAPLEWAREILAEKTNKSEYEHNLVVATTSEAIGWKERGIVGSLIVTYMRQTGKENDRNPGEFVGTIGQRTEFVVKVIEEKSFEVEQRYYKQNTVKHLIKMEDDNGNLIVWFTHKASEFVVGKKYRIKATVKDHKIFRGIKETVLTRVKLVDRFDETKDKTERN